ncbi:MAG: hypothetical protein HRT45_05505 [Bdellovibrionales bacterium]|nr:hypothetical protein [Bdellovibrionales bacterium]
MLYGIGNRSCFALLALTVFLAAHNAGATSTKQSGTSLACQHELQTEMVNQIENGEVIQLRYRAGMISLYNLSSTLSFSPATRKLFRTIVLASSIVLARFGDTEQDLNIVLVDEMLTDDEKKLATMSLFDEEVDAVIMAANPMLHFSNAIRLSPQEASILIAAFQTHRTLIAEQLDAPTNVDSMQIAVNVLKTVFPTASGRIQVGPKTYSLDAATTYY